MCCLPDQLTKGNRCKDQTRVPIYEPKRTLWVNKIDNKIKTKYQHKIVLQKSLIGRYRILETKQEY